MESKQMTYFYGLTDPDTGDIVYVGKSDDPHKRHSQHIYVALDKLKWETYAHSPKETWIIEMALDGKFPGMVILGKCENENWREIEELLIRYWTLANGRLLNTKRTSGQGGGNGKKTKYERRHWVMIKRTMKILGMREKLMEKYRDWLLTERI